MTQRVSLGSVMAMTLDATAVYALYTPSPVAGAPDPRRMNLARIGRSSGSVVTAGPLPGAVEMARVDAGLWIASGPVQGLAADTQWLRLIDATTLKVKRQLALPGKSTLGSSGLPRLASSDNLLWLGYANHLYRLDPATGATLLTRLLPGTATSVALDPSGQRVFAGVEVPPTSMTQDLVIESDAATGAQLASASTGGAGLGGPKVAAGPDSVWIAYATGMMGLVEHRRAADLASIPVADGRHANGIHVAVGGGVVWFWDAMAQVVACADPQTGAVRASVQQALASAFTADRAGTFLGDADGLAFLRPDPACFH